MGWREWLVIGILVAWMLPATVLTYLDLVKIGED